MKRKLLIVTIVVFGIAAAIFMHMLIAGALLAVWIYLVWMVRKKKATVFDDQVEPKLAESRLKRLKVFLLVAGILFAVGIVGVILHNVIYALSEIEEDIWFLIAIVALYVFDIATIGGLVIFLKGQRETR